jgi:sigma-B regulation protein RsbU (phosphoserine phosphatase)
LELSPSTSMVVRGAVLAVVAPLLVARRPIGPAKDASFVATVEVIGGIMVERAKAGHRFGQEDLAVLESLAADAAVAVDSARLYRETREKAKIDHEMALARTIQAALLRPPPQVPFADIFAFSQSARFVGGDLYHAAVREDGALAVALGDVSGKGVPAALIMAMVQGLLGLLHELGQPIASVLPALNRSLIEHNPGNRFLTLGAAVLAADGTLELANAGHCPLAVLRRDGTVQLVSPKGPILGLLPAATWGTDTLRLAPGESVVLYSDGISESFSPNDEEFGVEGVQRTLAGLAGAGAEDVAQGLLKAAAAHRAGREAEDDVTLLVVRYRGPA